MSGHTDSCILLTCDNSAGIGDSKKMRRDWGKFDFQNLNCLVDFSDLMVPDSEASCDV